MTRSVLVHLRYDWDCKRSSRLQTKRKQQKKIQLILSQIMIADSIPEGVNRYLKDSDQQTYLVRNSARFLQVKTFSL